MIPIITSLRWKKAKIFNFADSGISKNRAGIGFALISWTKILCTISARELRKKFALNVHQVINKIVKKDDVTM